ncbi:nucleophile aminohydrolase [Xylariaceae sp. FL0016]|nr:nucleophile aminohydrolase [Xylariaceae sp. FL0016]
MAGKSLHPQQSRQCAQPDGQSNDQPRSVRSYVRHVRSLLGKRKSEDDEPAESAVVERRPVFSEAMTSVEPTGDLVTDPARHSESNDFKNIDRDTSHPRKREKSLSPLEFDESAFLDGAGDRVRRNGKHASQEKSSVAAIFIHAGAGYHSLANERIHLEACSEAARTSMRLLKSGYSAIDAVEMAIRVLEDKEITNAGFGSNLAIDGTVECDATMVDHLGRSGACGAVPNIKNPISLAKLILQRSNQPLSLRRVPPNLLVSEGAKSFAGEAGMSIVPNEWLVSKNARDRFLRWREDLRRADEKEPGAIMTPPKDDKFQICTEHRDHAKALQEGTWNEGQPDSPGSITPSLTAQNPRSPERSPKPTTERSPLSYLGAAMSSIAPNTATPSAKRARFKAARAKSSERMNVNKDGAATTSPLAPHDGALELDAFLTLAEPSTSIMEENPLSGVGQSPAQTASGARNSEDWITDTVGAIAIDQSGHMAAGSSSGGIGMKHRGRVGPAALVGIGTAVIPPNEDDPRGITVAAVTSGTGEHMATTMASQKCAERIYHRRVRAIGGGDVTEADETSILESFIANDFQDHPSVKYSSSTGAIGVMAVKKTPYGSYLYFAHNTDSFALASMGSGDRDPSCVMSRVNEGCGIAQGARKIDA